MPGMLLSSFVLYRHRKTFVSRSLEKRCSKYHNIDQQSSVTMRSNLPFRGDSPRGELGGSREKSQLTERSFIFQP